LDTLRTNLAAFGIDVVDLRPLRDIAVQGNLDLALRPKTDIEATYPVYALPTAPEKTLPLWESLKRLTNQIGHYPVILGSNEDIQRNWEIRRESKSPEEHLKQAQDFDVEQWFQGIWKEEIASVEGDPEVGDYFDEMWDETEPPWLTLKPVSLF